MTPFQPLVDHALTSSYPVLAWTGYVLIGLAIGRAGLAGRRRAVALVLAGATLSIVAWVTSRVLLALSGGPDRLAAHTEGLSLVSGDMATQLAVGLPGSTPTTDWRWLLVSAPHSSTTFDLLHTGGAAVAILGVCLLVVRQVGAGPVLPLVAAGSMTLTLYSAHVVALWRDGPLLLDDPLLLFAVQVAIAVLGALFWRSCVGRGPLEAIAAVVDRSARRVVPVGRSDRPERSGSGVEERVRA
jgi:hypothetical protein